MSIHVGVIAAVVLVAFGCGLMPCAAAAEVPRPAEAANSLGMRFVAVPAGEFLMGSTDDDAAADIDERPQHRVRITRSFRLAKFETTQAEFRAVMGSNPSWFAPTGGGRGEVVGVDSDRLPVDMTTWHEAEEFCRKLGELPAERAAGRTYRLPTEAEWEYACRADSTWSFSDCEKLTTRQACIFESPVAGLPTAAKLRPQPVGSYPANRFGLHDMHGNVWEWCADYYSSDSYSKQTVTDPTGPESGTGRVIRGGDYRSPAAMARSANRDFTRATRRDQGNGFRVVLLQK
jgi:formylglycine-generating enzyme required for sulfatase activity